MSDESPNRELSAESADLNRLENESPAVAPDKEVGPVMPDVERRNLDDRRIAPRRRVERMGTDL